MIIAATGHRPPKLGGYSQDVNNRLRQLAREYLAEKRPNYAISGMALAWDMAWAEAAIEMDIPLIAAIPHKGQADKWPLYSQDRHAVICGFARDVFVLADRYTPAVMQARNEWMVDRCDLVAALWDGSRGGTANCIAYANKIGRPVDNLWERWSQPPA